MVEIIVTDLLDRVRERTARDAKNQLFNAGNIKMMFETRYIKPCQHVHWQATEWAELLSRLLANEIELIDNWSTYARIKFHCPPL